MVAVSDASEDPLIGLLTTAAKGDERAASELLRAIAPRVLKVVRQVLGPSHPEVEDVVQDALFGVLQALPGFRSECKVSYFASRVALLTAMNARRRWALRERVASSAPPDSYDELPGAAPSPSATLVLARRRRAVANLLLELPAAQAEVLAMHCVLGYTIHETAEACEVPANTVRSRLLAAKAALRKRLDDDPELARALDDPEQGVS